MSRRDELVIHAGELMPKDEALALMLVEFIPFGYSAATVESFVDRAFAATQKFLFDISYLPKEESERLLEKALAKDAQIAAHWRAQPPGVREAHAKLCTETEVKTRRFLELEEQRRFQADLARQKQWLESAQQQEKERQKAVREKADAILRKAQWERQFNRWMALNETGGRDAEAAARAAERKADDQEKINAILDRIRQHEASPDAIRYRMALVPGKRLGGTFNGLLNCLSDHSYIEWMFDCYRHGLMAPV